VIARDERALATLFADGAVFRAVVPNEARPFREKSGGAEAAEQLRVWFEDADVIELLDSDVETVADRIKIRYRVRVHEPDGWLEVEQQAYAEPSADGFIRMQLACSGFRPVAAPDGA
jgi:23S rRNA A2030 N6-methylase RlmJ